MGISIAVVVVTASLHLIAFVLAVGAERRRSTGRVVPDEYDDRTFCVYDSDASTVYGLSAFAALLVSQAVMSAATKCLCLGSALAGVRVGRRACTVASFAISWLCFLVAEVCLVAGSARNAYHTKYIGYYEKKDLTSCIALRKGVFAAAAGFVLILFASSLSFYWNYTKADTAGWVKHQNEGVGMAEYGHDKGELRSSNV
ncbi:uncharacterized protein LOC110036587 [Phalaenopsis equestris]|uniref:uncharacterized protein LOC110036587 n=1 Tax=Phalaenopsis equestris TaxID=78828 RepID=UPI0009E23E40|nr:uncharacterized protein LOC110036587 [Phalaenopsis equestris]